LVRGEVAVGAPRATGRGLPRDAAFWALGLVLGFLLFAASAPSPLYPVYQAQWHFSATTLTTVFAVYALALLATLVVGGALSDHVGRRPVLLAALALELAGMATFGLARGVVWLYAARVLQGLGTGVATSAITAALIDLQPRNRPGRGALLGSVAPTIGLAAGALGAGLLVQYAPDPMRLVYWLLFAVFAVSVLVVLAMPEPVRRDKAWLRSIRPHVEIPPEVRAAFVAVAPSVAAMWSLSGLYLSLGPSMTVNLLHAHNRVAGALVIVCLTGAGALASMAGRSWPPQRAMVGGSILLSIGLAVALVAIVAGSLGLFLVGSLVSGAGFGPAFSGAFRALTAQVAAGRRAGLIAAIYVVSYLAFSLPTIAAGVAVGWLGLRTTALAYGAVVIVLSTLATVMYAVHTRTRPGHQADRQADDLPPCPGTIAPCHGGRLRPDPLPAR